MCAAAGFNLAFIDGEHGSGEALELEHHVRAVIAVLKIRQTRRFRNRIRRGDFFFPNLRQNFYSFCSAFLRFVPPSFRILFGSND